MNSLYKEKIKGLKKEAHKITEVKFKHKTYYEAALFWGVSAKEVEVFFKEQEELASVSGLHSYTTTFAGYEAAGMMAFSDDKLYQITNLIEIETSNDNKYIDAYFEIKALLTKKYGAPTSEAEYLEGSYDKYFPRGTYAGQAISLGKGVYQSRFQCNGEDNKYIHLGLSGDNYKISLNLSYVDRAFSESLESKEKKKLDDF